MKSCSCGEVPDVLAVPFTRRDALALLHALADDAVEPADREMYRELWEQFTLKWRMPPSEQPTVELRLAIQNGGD